MIADLARAKHVWTVGTEPRLDRPLRILVSWPTFTELFEVDARWCRETPGNNTGGSYFEYSLWNDMHQCHLPGTPWRYLDDEETEQGKG